MNERTIIGVDPGVSGAMAVLWRWAKPSIYDIPVFAVRRSGRLRTEYNRTQCFDLLRRLALSGVKPVVYLEDVHAYPRDSRVAARQIGIGIGIWQGITAALALRLEMVSPAVWKRKMGLLKCNKDASRHKACEFFPDLASQLSAKKDHNRAEALLIAEYGRRCEKETAK